VNSVVRNKFARVNLFVRDKFTGVNLVVIYIGLLEVIAGVVLLRPLAR